MLKKLLGEGVNLIRMGFVVVCFAIVIGGLLQTFDVMEYVWKAFWNFVVIAGLVSGVILLIIGLVFQWYPHAQ